MSTQSLRFQISAAIVEALRTAPALADAVVIDHPKSPSDLSKGTRVIFVEDQSDDLIDQPNQQDKRSFGFSVGVINRTAQDRAGADADHLAAEAAIRQCHQSVLVATLRCGPLRELGVRFKVEGMDVGGALILASYAVEYRKGRQA